jgi:hypothetical protein
MSTVTIVYAFDASKAHGLEGLATLGLGPVTQYRGLQPSGIQSHCVDELWTASPLSSQLNVS